MKATRWPRALGLFALCLLWSSAWLVDGALPSSLATAPRQALHNLAIAIVLAPFAWKGLRSGPWLKLAAASVCLLGIPAVLVDAASSSVPQTTIAALFALVPVAVVVLAPLLLQREATPRLLPPALIALAGALLLLQFALPTTLRQASFEAVAILAVVFVAAAGIWLYRLLPALALLQAAVVCCLANAIFFAAVALSSSPIANPFRWRQLAPELATALLFDLPQILLLLWLMRLVSPSRFAARYLVVPLFTVLEGYLLIRPEIALQPVCGALLLAGGTGWLLTADESDREPTLVLH